MHITVVNGDIKKGVICQGPVATGLVPCGQALALGCPTVLWPQCSRGAGGEAWGFLCTLLSLQFQKQVGLREQGSRE